MRRVTDQSLNNSDYSSNTELFNAFFKLDNKAALTGEIISALLGFKHKY